MHSQMFIEILTKTPCWKVIYRENEEVFKNLRDKKFPATFNKTGGLIWEQLQQKLFVLLTTKKNSYA